MGIRNKVRRLINRYKPSWIGNPVAGLVDEMAELRRKQAELEQRVSMLANREDEIAALRRTQAELEKRASILASREEVDTFKSSLEVPFELIDEFQEWKAGNPIPQRPLVSVCLATFNRARLLTERCIPSILGQTYDKLELIIVGDKCTDETEELIAKIPDPRLRFINLSERDPYPADPVRRWMVAGTPAVNLAMSLARGDYITHLDDDDEFTPERFEKLLAFAMAEQCDLVWHPFWYETPTGEWLLNDAQEFAWTKVTTSAVFYRAWLTRIQWDVKAHRLMEPGDWNRFRRIKYVGAICRRYPEPLLRHYREGTQKLE